MDVRGFSRDLNDIAFILLPRFSMIAVVCALEPLRVANRFRPGTFNWRFVSVDGGPVHASNGIPVSASAKLASIGKPDLGIVCSSWGQEEHLTKPVVNPIRKLARTGTILAGLDTGPMVMAEAGLLAGRRATCHWESRAAMRETYPDVNITNSLYEIDRDLITCSGGAASIDMMLDVIERCYGRELTVNIADQLVHLRFAYGDDARLPVEVRLQIKNARLTPVVEAMEQNLEEPLSNGELARIGGVSVRHMERLFQTDFGTTPRRFYQRIRLDGAERLLRDSRMSVIDVAVACGFKSHAHFTRAYRARFGAPPSRHARPSRS